MTTPGNTNEPAQIPTTTSTKRKPGRIVKYILDHKMLFSLLFALIVVFIWGQCKISQLEKEQQAMTASHQTEMDSIQKADYLLVSRVFSWAVRSDMMRNNFDQANQYLEQITKEPNVIKAYAIDADKNTILLSTEKEEVGLPVSDITLLQPTETTVQTVNNVTRFISPITGLNRKIGISVIETNLK